MRIGLVEFLLILAIASLTIGPQVALFVDRWMRRANRANARAARRRAEYAAQMAVERDALLKRFRTAHTPAARRSAPKPSPCRPDLPVLLDHRRRGQSDSGVCRSSPRDVYKRQV